MIKILNANKFADKLKDVKPDDWMLNVQIEKILQNKEKTNDAHGR